MGSIQEMDPFLNECGNYSIAITDTNVLDLEEKENEVNPVDTLVKSEEVNTPENMIIEMASVVEVMVEETDDIIAVASDDPLNNDVAENTEMDNAKKSTKKVDTCQICSKEVVGHRLLQHYTNHCMQGIKDKFGHLMDLDKLECKLCWTKMKHKSGLTTHVGMVHMKVNDILVEKGFEPIQRNQKRIKNTYEVGPNEEKLTEAGPNEEKLTDETEVGPKEEELTDEVEDEPKEEKLADETISAIESSLLGQNFTCQICRNPSQNIGDLWNHYRNSHYSKSAEKDHNKFSTGLACNFCSKSFSDVNTLFMHIGVCYNLL